jgi:hypothetical protein
MTSKGAFFCTLTVLFSLTLRVGLLSAGTSSGRQTHAMASQGSTEKTSVDVRGIWSGTLYSKHSNVMPFTMTVEINPDARGHLIGASSLNSDCLKGAKLQVTVTGADVVLAGSDEAGDNITVWGTVDASGTLLRSSYILNGSATGKCETDDGTGDLAKR